MKHKTLPIPPTCPLNPASRPAWCQIPLHLKKLAGSLMVVGAILNSATAATLPDGFVETLVAGGLASPTAMEFAPDGRLFVCQQGGQLRVIKNGSLLATPFLTVTVNSTGERGLLGIAFDPGFASNQFVYVYYTATTPTLHNRVSRFTAKGTILAAQSITMLTSATLEGSALARVGQVAFDANPITVPNTLIPPVLLVSATAINSAYAYAPGQSVNLETKTITVPMSGNMRYYRIIAGTAFTITSATVSDSNLVIKYN